MAQSHKKYKHLFVVVRLNKLVNEPGESSLSEDDVMLTKAFSNQEEAEKEAERLNDLNEDFWHYFVSVARLVDDN